ncbi:MAG: hypothetical protein D9V47_14545 [Clostridia bacterium]|nr:MAG: hypothetical protein D9V47_14545 [Clostridia bacterium]
MELLVRASEHLETSTPVGRLIRNVLVDFAEFERENITDQVRDNMPELLDMIRVLTLLVPKL